MALKYKKVFQFRIKLLGTKPPVWRRILVPSIFTFRDLHYAIQDSFGWIDYHKHAFFIENPSLGKTERIGVPDPKVKIEMTPETECKISKYFSLSGVRTARYVYDFGDNWDHDITFEGIRAKREDTDYPICLEGKRACPPEDCGGVYGYQDFLKIISNPKHEKHEETLEWVGGEFDPEEFDPEMVEFANHDELSEV